MKAQEALEIIGIATETSFNVVTKLYLQKSEYYKKQIYDLKSFPHLNKEMEKHENDLNKLEEAYKCLGGKVLESDFTYRTELFNFKKILNSINFYTNKWRDDLLNSLKIIPGSLFFFLLLIMFVFLIILIKKT